MTPEYQRQWRLRNKNKEAYRLKAKEDRRLYKARHPERVKAQLVAFHKNHPNWRWERTLWRLYGWTAADYWACWEAQDSRCVFCNKAPRPGQRRFPVDHDHTKKKGDPGFIRGILCIYHNRALAGFGDNEAGLQHALNYVTGKKCQPPSKR
jgi:hypothetical protein